MDNRADKVFTDEKARVAQAYSHQCPCVAWKGGFLGFHWRCHKEISAQSSECHSERISDKSGLSPLTFALHSSFGLTAVLLGDRYVPQELEKVYVLLFQCVGNGSQLAQCSASCLNAVVLRLGRDEEVLDVCGEWRQLVVGVRGSEGPWRCAMEISQAKVAAAHSPSHNGGRQGNHVDDTQARRRTGRRDEPTRRGRTADPPLGHGQCPRQRRHTAHHGGGTASCRAVLPSSHRTALRICSHAAWPYSAASSAASRRKRAPLLPAPSSTAHSTPS